MNRYKSLLKNTQKSDKFIGLFPWGTIIDSEKTDHKKDEIHFTDQGIEFLQSLARKNVSVVMFINQFKPYPIPMDKLKSFADAVEGYVRSQNVSVHGVYWAPGYDKKDPFVVPNPGMFLRVTENLGTNWENIEVLSASEVDLSAAVKVKATPVLIGSEHKKYKSFTDLTSWVNSL